MKNEIVVVTGASAGLGRATALAFAKRGAHVALLARSAERLESARAEVERHGVRGLAIAVDVSDDRAVMGAAARVERELGPIDVWVNNAMVSVFSPIEEMTADEYRRVTDVTYLGYVWGTRAALRHMKARGRGVIVQVGSALGHRSIPLQSAYCAAKHAIVGFTESLRTELLHARSPISVVMVDMPALNTPQFDWSRSRMPRRAQPVPPIYQPEVGADAIVFAAEHPKRRSVWVGVSTAEAIVGNRIAPALLDRYLAKTAFESQQTEERERRPRADNLFVPPPGDPGAHGRFDRRSRRRAPALTLAKHRGAALAFLAGIGVAVAMRWIMKLRVPALIGALCLLVACSRSPREEKVEIQSATLPRNIGSLANEVDIREYPMTSPDALPHDPAVAPDGALWVTEQKANKLGRLDPKTGALREYALKVPGSGPHGLTVDEAGNVWFTANAKGYIGKLVPDPEGITEYPLPPEVKDPHTPLLGPNGILWFTAEKSNVVGKLDRRTGHVDLAPIPTRHALPYGITLGLDGAPYVCEFGSNKIASVDPNTLAVREFPLPVGARPRRIALALDGTLYYTDYERGRLGRLNPRSGAVDEWLSPGGPLSKPYGIAITPEGRVWYSESGVEPNTLVRFDPSTRTFAQIAIPSGGGVVRNMAPTLDGRVFLAESGVNKVAIVTPRR